MDWWNLQIPAPVALAAVAAIGYLISRRTRLAANDMVIRSRRELQRARGVATELEKIAWTVRQSLAKHHASVSRAFFRLSDQRVTRIDQANAQIGHPDSGRSGSEGHPGPISRPDREQI